MSLVCHFILVHASRTGMILAAVDGKTACISWVHSLTVRAPGCGPEDLGSIPNEPLLGFTSPSIKS